jgi:hypothetical protein
MEVTFVRSKHIVDIHLHRAIFTALWAAKYLQVLRTRLQNTIQVSKVIGLTRIVPDPNSSKYHHNSAPLGGGGGECCVWGERPRRNGTEDEGR